MTETEHSRGLELRLEWIVKPELFWAKVAARGPDDCWQWQRNGYRDGYGKHQIKTPDGWKERASHRIAFVLAARTTLPSGVHILHSCDNRKCCNPSHLSAGDRIRNRREAIERGRWKGRSARGGDSLTAKRVCVNGTWYPSVIDAAKATGIKYAAAAARARNRRRGWCYA